jgi:hypothetical protein
MWKQIFFLSAVLFVGSRLTAQPTSDQVENFSYTYSVEGALFKGFIIKHDDKIGHLARSHPQGFRVSYVKKTYGQKQWEKTFGYPDLGISFGLQDYLNPGLGQSLALVPFFRLYPIRNERSSLSISTGTGLAYHTNPHDQTDNHRNLALGSAVSFALIAALQYDLQLSPHFATGIYLHIDHYSNGGIKKPNSGINLMQTGFSVTHHLQPVRKQFRDWPKEYARSNKLYLTINPSVGFKELGRGGDRVYPSYNLNMSVNKPLNNISTLNVGLEGFYDIALKRWLEREKPEHSVDFKSAAILMGHELHVNRCSFMLHLGYHFYRPYSGLYPEFYQRYGLRIYLNPKLAFSGTLKTYLGQAEQIEWGLVYRW